MQYKRKPFIVLFSLLILLVLFFMPLEWIGIPRDELRNMFDSNINARLAATQLELFDDLSALTEASAHVVRAEILSKYEPDWFRAGDTGSPPLLQTIYTIRVLEVYQTKKIYYYDITNGIIGEVSIGDIMEIKQLIPLYGRSMVGRLMPRPTQARLQISVDDELILFLESSFGMGRRMYELVNSVQSAYFYVSIFEEDCKNRTFPSVNQHNRLVLKEQDLLRMQVYQNEEDN
jgi:hypothetical protein